jgi:hypothetical protein
MAQMAIILWVVAFLVAIALAIWIFRDAEARGKSGLAAGLIAFLSAFYGIPFTVMVVCTWILFRPDKPRRDAKNAESRLPEKLPSGIVAAPTAKEFLEGLEENP